MTTFVHVPGKLYRILDGVRRAKAADMFGHVAIKAEVVDRNGQSQGIGEMPIAALRSPKTVIRRITASDESRWNRAVAGAKCNVLPYPPIIIQPSKGKGVMLRDVSFDFGGNP